MKKLSLFIILLAILSLQASAQKRNNVWAYGDRQGMDFNSGTPVLFNTSIHTLGGSASVCDTSGQLLFYTQGDTIFNKLGTIMPNGSGIIAPYASNSTPQSSQGQLIVPFINNPNRYYVFSEEIVTDDIFGGDTAAGRLFYCVVDMTLDSGRGDVVSGLRTVELDSALTSEKMIAIPGDNCNIWLLVHSIYSNRFKAYSITDSGISTTPVISDSGNSSMYAFGKMKVSPDRTKLAVSNFLFSEYGLELYDFNAATGMVSNPIVIDTLQESISDCFSPDNSKLYVTSFDGGNGALYQFNLSLPSITAVIASKTLLFELGGPGCSVYDAKRGPDGKVYVKMPYSAPVNDTIGCINFPNLAGTACGFTNAALVSAAPIFLGNGDLPNEVVEMIHDTTYASSTLSLPAGDSTILTATTGYTTYMWSTGDTSAAITITDSGTYYVTCINYCGRHTDTFYVTQPLSVTNVNAQSALAVYPNPAKTNITISLTNASLPGNINITDMTGRIVKQVAVHNTTTNINTASLTPGIYNITYTGGASATRQQAHVVIAR